MCCTLRAVLPLDVEDEPVGVLLPVAELNGRVGAAVVLLDDDAETLLSRDSLPATGASASRGRGEVPCTGVALDVVRERKRSAWVDESSAFSAAAATGADAGADIGVAVCPGAEVRGVSDPLLVLVLLAIAEKLPLVERKRKALRGACGGHPICASVAPRATQSTTRLRSDQPLLHLTPAQCPSMYAHEARSGSTIDPCEALQKKEPNLVNH